MALENMIFTKSIHTLLVLNSKTSLLDSMIGCPDMRRWIARTESWVPIAASPAVKIPALVMGCPNGATLGLTGGH